MKLRLAILFTVLSSSAVAAGKPIKEPGPILSGISDAIGACVMLAINVSEWWNPPQPTDVPDPKVLHGLRSAIEQSRRNLKNPWSRAGSSRIRMFFAENWYRVYDATRREMLLTYLREWGSLAELDLPTGPVSSLTAEVGHVGLSQAQRLLGPSDLIGFLERSKREKPDETVKGLIRLLKEAGSDDLRLALLSFYESLSDSLLYSAYGFDAPSNWAAPRKNSDAGQDRFAGEVLPLAMSFSKPLFEKFRQIILWKSPRTLLDAFLSGKVFLSSEEHLQIAGRLGYSDYFVDSIDESKKVRWNLLVDRMSPTDRKNILEVLLKTNRERLSSKAVDRMVSFFGTAESPEPESEFQDRILTQWFESGKVRDPNESRFLPDLLRFPTAATNLPRDLARFFAHRVSGGYDVSLHPLYQRPELTSHSDATPRFLTAPWSEVPFFHSVRGKIGPVFLEGINASDTLRLVLLRTLGFLVYRFHDGDLRVLKTETSGSIWGLRQTLGLTTGESWLSPKIFNNGIAAEDVRIICAEVYGELLQSVRSRPEVKQFIAKALEKFAEGTLQLKDVDAVIAAIRHEI